MAVSEDQKQKVKQLLIEGRKIEAIKYLRATFGLDLKAAKKLADHIADEMEPIHHQRPSLTSRSKKQGCRGKAIGVLFFGIGVIFLLLAIINIVLDVKQISESELVIGEVISNPSQPTIGYEFNGKKFSAISSVSSNPPSYHIGEEIEVYVHPDYPKDSIINTFTERWFLVVMFFGMGAVFSIVGLVTIKLL